MSASSENPIDTFTETVFPGAKGSVVVWIKQSKRTRYFDVSNIKAASDYIKTAALTQDVYVSIATQLGQSQRGRRGAASTAAALVGLFADIDFADHKGEGTGYPKDLDEALLILDSFPIKPTLIVDTGNGLHVHFLFQTPWIFTGEADRAAAVKLSAGFQRKIVEHFRRHGRKIDSVGDIVRNCRIPGTLNHKGPSPKNVTLLKWDPDGRLSVAALQDFVGKDAAASATDERQIPGPLADHDAIVRECAWYRDEIVKGAAGSSEPDWFAGVSITALCKNGEAIFLDYSANHPDFKLREAQDKFRRAVKAEMPRTCESVANDLGHREICQVCPHWGRIKSPIQLGRESYDPGEIGPRPLGYTADGSYVFLDPVRQLLVPASSAQLLSPQFLVGLAPMAFWSSRFPPQKGGGMLNLWSAGQALMAACRRKGPFEPRKVRGRGVWLEEDLIIVNFGDPLPSDLKGIYLCFESLPLRKVRSFETRRLREMLGRFIWRNPQDAELLLGWLAIAPICGVLAWRPHCFIYGPPNCGKSTIHGVASALLYPLGLSADGQSSEAGIRQMIKADSRPVVIDEFESDQMRGHIAAVLRLARSASSSESPVLRGTPEGRAMQFALRTTFFFAAVNPSGMSPADATRILLFEMMAHASDPVVAKLIADDEAYFVQKGPEWCGYMAGLAHLLPGAIAAFSRALPSIDSRHRKNVATLLAGAFVAMHARAPTDAEALGMAENYRPSIDLHAEEFERDDAAECLQHLFAFPVEKQTLGFWLAASRAEKDGDLPSGLEEGARRIPRNFEIVIRVDDGEGLFIRNGSPAVEAVFRDTKWARGAWEKALRKTAGYFAPSNPVHFANTKKKSRAIGLPLDLLPDIDFSEYVNALDGAFANERQRY